MKRLPMTIAVPLAAIACNSAEVEIDPFNLPENSCEQCFIGHGETHLADGTVIENVRVVLPDGELVDAWRDGQGRVLSAADIASLDRRAKQLRWQKQGAMTDDLVKRIAEAGTPELIPSFGWLLVPFENFDRENLEDVARASAIERARAKRRLAALKELLAPYPDARIKSFSETPLVAIDAPAEALELIAKSGHLVQLEPDYGPGHPTSTHWHPAIGADVTEAAGWDGTGVRVAVLEGGQPDDYTQLSGIIAIASPGGYADTHMRGTAGVIRSVPAPFGVANNAGILVANWGGYAGGEIKIFATDNNAKVVNISWSGIPWDGGLTVHMLFDDWLSIHYPYPLFVLAAGNNGDDPDPANQFVHHKSYNTLKVGAANPNGTEARFGDTIAGFSSWRNPTTTNNDRELPEMTAFGVDVDAAGLIGLAGTSFAAPMVAGSAAVLIERNSTLGTYPELNKAILMAGADCNISQVVLVLTDTYDDKDGNGNLNVAKSAAIANPANASPAMPREQGYFYGLMTFASATQWTGNKFNTIGRVRTGATGYFKAVLTWDSTGTCTDPEDATTCTPAGPDADLNLYLKHVSSGSYVRTSISRDNNYEVINGSPLSPNTDYELEIWKTAAAPRNPSTYYGIAWTSIAPACPDP